VQAARPRSKFDIGSFGIPLQGLAAIPLAGPAVDAFFPVELRRAAPFTGGKGLA
jgi:hypothetical protein